MFEVKINVRNEIPMPELVKIDLLFVKIAPQMKNPCWPEPMAPFFENAVFRDFPPKIERGIGAHS